MTASEVQHTEQKETTKTNSAAPLLSIGEKTDHNTNVQPKDTFATTEEEWKYPWPTDFKLSEHYIDDIPTLKVCVIGAGLAGITAGVLLAVKVPGIELTIIEKNADVGGTWYENVYPGVRCDIPSNVYQSSFFPNTNWSEQYAQGSEILQYWQSVARKYDVYSLTKLNTKVVSSHWEPSRSQWRVETLNTATGDKATDYFHFLITAIGHFNEWKLPSYPGMSDFRGVIHHSSAWDPSFDPNGKRIATIGNGASGIQVTTALQKVASHVDHYVRNPTWIAGSFNAAVEDRKDTPMQFTEEQLQAFKDLAAYLEYRKALEDNFFRGFDGQLKNSETSKNAKKKFLESMRQRLDGDEELVARLTPDFPPNCRRLTPGPGYLEALKAPNVNLIQTPIERFTASGIVTTDGVHREVDAVIASTGANVDYAPPFPITANGLDLSGDWKSDGKFGFPYSYLGLATPGFLNLAYILGPNPAGINGTVPHAVETQVVYIAKMLRKMSSQRVKSMMPSKSATDEFVEYCDAFFPRTNLSLKCSSWSNGGKAGNRIHGHWPGSGCHSTIAKAEPRWEDYTYEYERPENRFAYFGNGQTKKEHDLEADLTPYLSLKPDLKDLHERWHL